MRFFRGPSWQPKALGYVLGISSLTTATYNHPEVFRACKYVEGVAFILLGGVVRQRGVSTEDEERAKVQRAK